jgi:hypothetical protein
VESGGIQVPGGGHLLAVLEEDFLLFSAGEGLAASSVPFSLQPLSFIAVAVLGKEDSKARFATL